MNPIQFVRDFYLWLKYRRALLVNSREELDAALHAMPPRIVVEGDEALRAYAASLMHPETEAASRLETEMPAPGPGDAPVYLVVPTVGRIRDGYRAKAKPKRGRRFKLKGGVDAVLVASIGIVAALLVEWLSFPDLSPRMVRGGHRGAVAGTAPEFSLSGIMVWIAIPVLAAVALGAFAWLVWQALGLGRPVQTGWRLEHRIQGRLVMGRVRRRVF